MEKEILFGRRRVPNIFSVLDPSQYQVSYDDNIIGDERYIVRHISGNGLIVVRTIKSPLNVISYRQLGFGKDPLNDKMILINEESGHVQICYGREGDIDT